MMSTRRSRPESSRLRTRVALLAVAALVLSACGGADDAESTSTPTPAPGAPAAPAVEASGEVVYWHHFTSESEMAGLEQQEAAFGIRRPAVSLVSETVPNADYMAKVVTAVQANRRPDTGMVTVDRLPDLVAMGALVPLTDRIKSWELYEAYPDALWDDITYEGEIYGIPAFTFVNWLYYRADWFAEAGIDGCPATWDDMTEAAIAITDPSKGRYGFGLRGGPGGGGMYTPILESYGATVTDGGGKPTLDQYRDEVVASLAFYTGLKTEHDAVPDSVASDSYAQLMEAFRTGQTGMVLHHTGSLAEISADLEPGVEFKTCPVPTGPEGLPGGRVSALYNGLFREDNVDAGWEWLIHWGDAKAQLDFLDFTGYFPPSAEAQGDVRITGNPIYQAAADAAAVGISNTKFIGKSGWESQVVLPVVQKILTGQATVEQGADEIIAGLAEQIG